MGMMSCGATIDHSTGSSEVFPDPLIAQCTMGVGYEIILKMCSRQSIDSNLSEGTGSPAPKNASSFCVTSFGESSQPTASSTEWMLLPIVKHNVPIICTSSITTSVK